MRPRRAVAVVLLLVVVGSAAAVADAGTPASGGDAGVDPPEPAVVMQINLTPDGDARWTVTSRFAIPNNSSGEAIRSLAADVENGTPPVGAVGYSAETFRSFADRVEAEVDRSAEMRIENARWNSTTRNDTVELSLSFTWTDFARTGPNRVILGDVFDVESTWFSSVEPGQRLVINPPPGWAVDSSALARPFDDGAVSFPGPANLSAMNVSIVYVESEGPPPTDTPTPTPGTPTTPPNGTPGDGSAGGGGPGLMLVGGGLLLVVLAVAFALYANDVDPFGDGTGTTAGDGGTTAPAGTGTGGGSDAAGPAAATEAGTAEGQAEPTAEGGEAADAEDEDDGIDEELLSDEERVERLLERNGGRMKQANIVSETGWSNAKVSQLLSSMDEDDRVDKLRIGRENLITLPDEDVGDFE